jgi:hypothetical protein
MGTDGACGLLFCAAKRSGTFPPNIPRRSRAQLVRQWMGPTIPGGLPPGLGGATHAEATTEKRGKYR